MSITNPFGPPLCRNCWRAYRIAPPIQRPFHSSPPWSQESVSNHYDTLGLLPSASTSEIKKQFYALSKKYHPDLNPSDKTSSQKFVAVSEAYHVLGSEDQRKEYDREHMHTRGQASSPFPHGSHSSHTSRRAGESGPGGRPASGLSRRRTQFRGPPPSFYQSGGYGRHSSKRYAAGGDPEGTANSSTGASSKAETNPGGLGSEPPGGSFGYGPGQDSPPSSEYIPYWDKDSHQKTHDNLRQRRERSGAARALGLDEENIGGSMALNFILVSTLIGLVAGVSHWIQTKKEPRGSSTRARDNG
ncbi:hypothetical protein BLS_009198 [Venturia inaequalis]|uniref:J domain-containing protein n=1 Tax=Venturia inaequalis TaxID=5025 RepID=A0A8H3U4W2_VENIN|nr:hypothetical protein BLS_009198 [Venturia inaequalis]